MDRAALCFRTGYGPSFPARMVRVVGVVIALLLAPAVGHAQQAELFVETNVADATIVVDGQEVGQTNEEGEVLLEGLAPGRRTVEVRKPGYWTATTRTALEEGLTNQVTLELMPRSGETVSSLLIRTNVRNAEALIDGTRVGQTGPDGQVYVEDVAPGSRQVTVRKEGYERASRTVDVNERGLDQTVEFQLEPRSATADAQTPSGDAEEAEPQADITAGAGLPDSVQVPDANRTEAGLLVVDTEKEGAQVAVGDSVRGRTGPEGRLAVRVKPGSTRVAARRDGAAPIQTRARVEAGERQVVSLSLQRTASAEAARSDLPVGDDLLLIFVGLLVALAGVVATFLGISGWKQGTFTRWVWDSERFDRYDVLDVLQRNEFTTVYLANDAPAHRKVALKVLDDPYASKPDHVQQFIETGHLLQNVRETDPDAPVLEVYRVDRRDGTESGRPFIAYEHIQGDNLLVHLKDAGKLGLPGALSVVRQVCVALRAAHENGASHGSLTPEAIVVVQEDPRFEIKLVGFGLEAQEHATQILTDGVDGSTAAYVAPEQLRNGRTGWRTDIYAVGMLFYKLVTGAPPYAEDTPTGVLKRQEEAPRPDLPDHVPSVIKPVFYRMISKDPDRRPDASRILAVLDLIETAV